MLPNIKEMDLAHNGPILLRIFIDYCLSPSATVKVDQTMVKLLGIDGAGMIPEKAYSKAKKIVRKSEKASSKIHRTGIILNSDPKTLSFTTLTDDFLLSSLRYGPVELRREVFRLIAVILLSPHLSTSS